MWTPVETQFYAKTGIHWDKCIGDFQHYTIQTFAEELNLAVRFYRMGTPGDFLKVITSNLNCPLHYYLAPTEMRWDCLVYGGLITSMLKDESSRRVH